MRHFAAWREKMASDADVNKDARMMVPVFFDPQRGKTKVWAFLGWKTVPVNCGYEVPPKLVDRVKEEAEHPLAEDRLSVLRRKFRKVEKPPAPAPPPPRPPIVKFETAHYRLATPVMAEVYVSRLLDRDEFRKSLRSVREEVCDSGEPSMTPVADSEGSVGDVDDGAIRASSPLSRRSRPRSASSCGRPGGK
jgi:hypothetical protein